MEVYEAKDLNFATKGLNIVPHRMHRFISVENTFNKPGIQLVSDGGEDGTLQVFRYPINAAVTADLVISKDAGSNPTKLTLFNANGPSQSCEIDWERNGSLWLPRNIKSDSYKNGAFESSSQMCVTSFEPNPELPESSFGLDDLDICENSKIVDQRI